MILKKRKNLVNNLSDLKCIVYDFRRRKTKFESYRPSEYKLIPEIQDEVMIKKIDKHLRQTFSSEIDDGNGDILDALLFSVYREAIADLTIQRNAHKDMIKRLAAREKTDYLDFTNLLDNRIHELDGLQEEYKKINELIERKEKNDV